MGLKEYFRKRDFAVTPEPKGAEGKRDGRSFVIQKHAASHLHYDFRLELEGVLKSWAVPKGPSLDPADKRLAMETEDHPIEYGSFEGIIPAGQYGGGTVVLWDRGTWKPVEDPHKGYRAGRLKFELEGEKLGGLWTLVKTGGKNSRGESRSWLLFKDRDEHAKPGAKKGIAETRPESVATGRTLEEIASAKDRVWNSNRGTAENVARGATAVHAAKSVRAAKGTRPVKAEPAAKGTRAAKTAKTSKATTATTAKTPKTAKTKSPKSAKTKTTKAGPVVDVAAIEGARASRLPDFVQPQLPTLVSEPVPGEGWLHEMKLDGYRILCRIDRGAVTLLSRNAKDWTKSFTSIASAASALPATTALLDGEVAVLLPDGRTSFNALQNALSGETPAGLVYFVFDVLHLDGRDLTPVPLVARKDALKALLASAPAKGPLRYSDHITGDGEAFFREACRLNLEGVVSKRKDAPYEPGRGRSWLKVKCLLAQEFVIVGFTDPEGSRVGIGALLLGVHDAGGALRYVGKVGTGFSQKIARELRARVDKLERKTAPFDGRPPGLARAHWVEPELVAEAVFSEWTPDGKLRHPSFKGLREDKPAREIVREVPQPLEEVAAPAARKDAKSMDASASKKRVATTKKTAATTKKAGAPAKSEAVVAGVTLTNADRVLYPELGLTKLDLARFYESIADWMLPHLVDRPTTLVRCPEGLAKPCFYQKHTGWWAPPSLRRAKIQEREKVGEYLFVDDVAGLVGLVQIGILEIHTWNSVLATLEKPDRLVFDLDPDEELPWSRTVEAALLVRERVEAVGLASFVKTTGGKGLHVVVPLVPRAGWDECADFARTLCQEIETERPEHYTSVMSKARRKGKIFLDYLRNVRGATSVTAYSTRAKPRAPLSVPLFWEELAEPRLEIDPFALPKRLARKEDPWAEYERSRVDLAVALAGAR